MEETETPIEKIKRYSEKRVVRNIAIGVASIIVYNKMLQRREYRTVRPYGLHPEKGQAFRTPFGKVIYIRDTGA